jgi:LemA protein
VQLQGLRWIYNANVRDFNTRTEVFPALVVARLFGFTPAELFEVEDSTVRAAPVVALPGAAAG